MKQTVSFLTILLLLSNTVLTTQSNSGDAHEAVKVVHPTRTIFSVKNVPAALMFYNKALGIETKSLQSDKQYGELETGEAVVAFVSQDTPQTKEAVFDGENREQQVGIVAISFRVRNVHVATEAVVTLGAVAISPLYEPDEFGATLCWFKDPNGVPFVLYSLPDSHPVSVKMSPPSTPELSDTVMIVSDVDTTASFYKEAFGITIGETYLNGRVHELDANGTSLLLFKAGHFDISKPSDGSLADVKIALTTTPLSTTYESALRAGATPIKESEKITAEQAVAWVRDCNGVIVELSTPC